MSTITSQAERVDLLDRAQFGDYLYYTGEISRSLWLDFPCIMDVTKTNAQWRDDEDYPDWAFYPSWA